MMLPLPSSSSRKPRTYFPSLPSSHSHSHSHSSSNMSLPQLLASLRARTRLTNLAVSLLLFALCGSLLLNLNNFLFSSSSSSSSLLRGSRRKANWATWDTSSLSQIESGIPPSIETTIERDSRYLELNHLIMVPGHAIWLGHDSSRADEDDDWVLEPMQRGGSVKTYIKHIEKGVEVLKDDPKALLVFSGGATRTPPSPPFPEALSYHHLATSLDLLPSTPLPLTDDSGSSMIPLPLNLRAATEEYALDSYENLLFSIARFKEVTSRWPERITVVGYGMKRRRFENLHRSAISFPSSSFSYIGIDDMGDTTSHYAGEMKYGYKPFTNSPSGCHPPLSIKRLTRNPYFRYHPYHISCPELQDLLEWCPPLENVPDDIALDESYLGISFKGYVPWRKDYNNVDDDEDVRWNRERY